MHPTEAVADPGDWTLGNVTRILADIERGNRQAAAKLLLLVYDELRKLAADRLGRESPGNSLDATALVHEAYLRLVGSDPEKPFDGRGQFFAAAAEAIRRILIDRARDRKRLKRGGERRRVRSTSMLCWSNPQATICSHLTRR
jgi:RNA polymerase sigma factor (TIGR02999 family)